jgi:hypothetical protein
MSSLARTALNPRSAAVAELFDALEGLMVAYHALPEHERAQQWSADADRITGDVGRHLSTARTRISSTFVPRTSTPS